MEYFRCNIIRIITAILIMVVSIQGGMFEYILSIQTNPAMSLEEPLHYGASEYANMENESNDECYPSRVKKHSIRITALHFANFNSSHSIKRQATHIIIPATSTSKISRHLSELFCTLLI